ncbi:PGAP1-domain-containing protein [Punctularia strigosozonata HHB-11173 SS5]|uniref:PGAP1-domain-containing protein n=1 Tax=Punctularia strigosozonata (strain HHB-11173) TaxID=741275 RepID=UPI00044176EF|nr:PGAP1-domain-containing protein [Punctularia strigosozonata HHB-11173 SS5]EIN10779.1 PGAP1-domain-containing protein [Punctularia strigosozonata HHB-11173 SS5]
MIYPRPLLLGLCSLLFILVVYLSASTTPLSLSAQGCRMSWMSPSYLLQTGFDHRWTRPTLARRYSLWLYREVGWEDELHGSPVLFIPGNAGSSHQVRSIASSATRQYFSSPYIVAPEFAARNVRDLDFFAVEYNEDLSAFHGTTLESQTSYAADAVRYILSLYPPNTHLTILGHSMGGIAAVSLLDSPIAAANISAVITMSTPHTLPPARFDRRIDSIYRTNAKILAESSTPILSLCGGATDMMIPSESCILPSSRSSLTTPYRKTVFASGLAGAWTGVGHREMVWCHQVRWRVARAALELAHAPVPAAALDAWLDDGRVPSAVTDDIPASLTLDLSRSEVLPASMPLVLVGPNGFKERIWLITIPRADENNNRRMNLVMYVSGAIPPVAPQNANALQVTVYYCAGSSSVPEDGKECERIAPFQHRLLPSPVPGKKFPVPGEGSDESEGVVYFEADVTAAPNGWVALRVQGADGRGWVAAGFEPGDALLNDAGTFDLAIGKTLVNVDPTALRTRIHLPNLLANVLLVYRLTPIMQPTFTREKCSQSFLSPLLTHTSGGANVETHYHPLSPLTLQHPVLLHTHISGPYIASSAGARGIELTIHSVSKSDCGVAAVEIKIDQWSTLGRWGSRHWPALVCWSVGVASILLFQALGAAEAGLRVPSLAASLSSFAQRPLPALLLASLLLAHLPLPASLYIGTGGEIFFTPIAPLLLATASGLVCLSYALLIILMLPLRLLSKRQADTTVHRRTVFSMLLILLLIFLLVPWQVAFLGAWCIHLYTSATSRRNAVAIAQSSRTTSEGSPQEDNKPEACANDRSPWSGADRHNMDMHILLFLTWLLPLTAPVLAVWVRTLLTAGWTTPFDGDHNPLLVAPFLVLVDFASWTSGILLPRQSREPISLRITLIFVSLVAFVWGPRHTYTIFDATGVAIGALVTIRIGPRYWGGVSYFR